MKAIFEDHGVLTIAVHSQCLDDLKSRLTGALSVYGVSVSELEENQLLLKGKGLTFPSERNPLGAISEGKLKLSLTNSELSVGYSLTLGGLKKLVLIAASLAGLAGLFSQTSLLLAMLVGTGGSVICGLMSFIFYYGVYTSSFSKTIRQAVAGGFNG